VSRFRPGRIAPQGSLSFEVPNRHLGGILAATLGSVSTSGTGPYTHTFSAGDLTSRSLSVQIRKPALGSNPTHTYLGCKVTQLTLECEQGGWLTAEVEFVARDESTTTTYTTPTFATGYSPFAWLDVSATVGGSPLPIRSVRFEIQNPLATERWFMRSTSPRLRDNPLESGKREITGSFVTDWDADAIARYAAFVSGTPATIIVTANQAADSQLIISANAYYSGQTPVVSGPELLPYETPFFCFHATSDSTAFNIQYVTSESTI
jgi:hypothetical protein